MEMMPMARVDSRGGFIGGKPCPCDMKVTAVLELIWQILVVAAIWHKRDNVLYMS